MWCVYADGQLTYGAGHVGATSVLFDWRTAFGARLGRTVLDGDSLGLLLGALADPALLHPLGHVCTGGGLVGGQLTASTVCEGTGTTAHGLHAGTPLDQDHTLACCVQHHRA